MEKQQFSRRNFLKLSSVTVGGFLALGGTVASANPLVQEPEPSAQQILLQGKLVGVTSQQVGKASIFAWTGNSPFAKQVMATAKEDGSFELSLPISFEENKGMEELHYMINTQDGRNQKGKMLISRFQKKAYINHAFYNDQAVKGHVELPKSHLQGDRLHIEQTIYV